MIQRFVAVTCLFGALIASCGGDDKSVNNDVNAGNTDAGITPDSGSPTNGTDDDGGISGSGDGGMSAATAAVLEEADVDLEALSIAPESLADCDADLSLALLEGTHAVRGQLASFDLGCDPEGQDLEVTIDGDVVETIPTGGAFAVSLPEAATIVLNVTVGNATAELELELEDAPEIADPREYVLQTIDTLLASLEGDASLQSELAPQAQIALEYARELLDDASDEEVEQVATFLWSYGIGEDVVQRALCNAVRPELKFTCLEAAQVARRILLAAFVAGTVAACGLTLAAPNIVTAIACGVGIGAMLHETKASADLNTETVGSAIQLNAPEYLENQQNVATVESGVATQWSGEGTYVSVSGFVLGAGKERASAFQSEAGKLFALLVKAYEFARSQFDGPSLNDPPLESPAEIDPQYVTITLDAVVEGVSLQVATTTTGWDITLTNISDEEKMVKLRFNYVFDGVQELEKVVDVVVQESPGNCTTDEGPGAVIRTCRDAETQVVISREMCTIAEGVCQSWERRLYHPDGTTTQSLIQAAGHTGADSTSYVEEIWNPSGVSLSSGYSRIDTSGYQYNYGRITTDTTCRYYESTVPEGGGTPTGCDSGVVQGACPPIGCGPTSGGPQFSFRNADAITPLTVSDVTILTDDLCGTGCAYAQ